MKVFKRLAKVLLWLVGCTICLLALLWAFHSPMVKWAVRKYSPEYTGRQITLERFHLNPLNGKLRMGGLKIMEASGDSAFLVVDDILINATLYKMFTGEYEITALHVHHPVVRIFQNGERFNFSDVLERFASDTTVVEDTTEAEPVPYALYDLRVDSLILYYNSHLLPKPLHFVDAGLSCPQVKWDVPRIEATVHALGANGMDLAADLDFDLERMRYTAQMDAKNIPCKIAAAYVQPYFSISGLDGTIRADLFMRGSADDPMAFSMKGRINVDDFAMNDPNGVKLVGLKALDLVIDTVDVKQELYRVRRFVLDKPYILAELYDDGDNFTKWMPAESAVTDTLEEELGYDPENPFSMLAYYVKMVAENYQTMDYKVDSLAVINGTVYFKDYTLEQSFQYSLTDISLVADDINSGSKEITLRAHAVLNSDGTFDGELALDPHTIRNMRFNYTAEGVGMPVFGPYTIHYVAHPILSGRTRYVCNTTITDNKLKSEMRILVEGFNFGKKMEVADAFDLPMRLAVSLMKDKDGNIDLTIPVEGDLDDPEYKVMPIVWQVLKNLLVKAVSAPYTLLARAFEADEDDLRTVHFLFLQQELTGKQEKPLHILARVAKDKPDMRIELVQAGDHGMEAEAYAIRTAKAAYYTDSTGIAIDTNTADLGTLLKDVSIKSPGFRTWIEGKVGAGDEPMQKKCMRLIGAANAEAEVARIWAVRSRLVTDQLLEEKVPVGAILVRDRVQGDTIPALGEPSFHVIYGASEEGPVPVAADVP